MSKSLMPELCDRNRSDSAYIKFRLGDYDVPIEACFSISDALSNDLIIVVDYVAFTFENQGIFHVCNRTYKEKIE